jgi:hypothetical protein
MIDRWNKAFRLFSLLRPQGGLLAAWPRRSASLRPRHRANTAAEAAHIHMHIDRLTRKVGAALLKRRADPPSPFWLNLVVRAWTMPGWRFSPETSKASP